MSINRRSFLQASAFAMLNAALHPLAHAGKPRMPVLFIGHGSPINAVQDNAFTRALASLGRTLPRPTAILAISAHWQTPGKTLVDSQQNPPTIHDFRGFPPELSEFQYPASGSPELANKLVATLNKFRGASADNQWGLDHGTWSVLAHIFPQADIPVVQLSIDYSAPGSTHYALGRELAYLRKMGVLILGSGGIVHNLRALEEAGDSDRATQSWAQEFDDRVAKALRDRNDDALQNYHTLHPQARLAVPTPDHYWPLLYVLGAADAHERPQFPFEGFQHGTLSMRCVRFG